MSKTLNIADALSLPIELAARTQCIFAQKGAGKTYAGGVEAEEMLGASVQICVLDPTGVWWGLQSSADGGKSPYEIIVMGGAHGDVPLEPDAGEIVANFLIETGQSVVLDVSQFESQAAQDRFALALATKLYRLKAYDRGNIHIFLDEADQFCPMKPQKGQERLLHAWDTIVRLGRSRGLGLTAISQRPAVVHTNIRNNVDLLTCLRVTGLHDFKALKEWTGINATAEQARAFLEMLPKLEDGEAFFWSPSWLKIFQRAKVRTKRTFDSSRTPKPGERAIKPKDRRAPDLSKLTEQIKASVQRAKANDPTALRNELAKVKAELVKAQQAKPTVEMKTIEKAVFKDSQIERLEGLHTKASDRATTFTTKLAEIINPLLGLLNGEQAQIGQLLSLVKGANVNPPAPAPLSIKQAASLPVGRSPANHPVKLAEGKNGHPGASPLGKCERAILTVLAQHPEGCESGKITLLAGYRYSGGFQNSLSSLRTRGFMVGENTSTMKITQEGMNQGPFEALPSGKELVNHWLTHSSLGKAERKILSELVNHPKGMTAEQLCAACDYTYSGGFQNALSALRTAGVMVGKNRETMRASDELLRAAGHEI